MSNYCNYSVQSARFLGTVGGGLASSAHERLLQRLAAVIAQHGIAVALARCVLRVLRGIPTTLSPDKCGKSL
jgi:hypothetical protein